MDEAGPPTNPPTACVDSYRAYLGGRLCWIDGSRTHASSRTQRQCPRCRFKWSYVHADLEFSIFEKFCNGERARRAAVHLGCSRNTVHAHYGAFKAGMEELIAEMVLEGTIATNPQSIDEVVRLERALRAGSRNRRAAACRYLFLGSLEAGERSRRLFTRTLGARLESRISEAQLTSAFAAGRSRSRRGRDIRWCVVAAPPDLSGTSRARGARLLESIKAELAVFLFRNHPPAVPSAACVALGERWVEVWKVCRDTIGARGAD